MMLKMIHNDHQSCYTFMTLELNLYCSSLLYEHAAIRHLFSVVQNWKLILEEYVAVSLQLI